MAERGIDVTCETIRTWCARFGPEYARRLRQRAPRPGNKWHLDEVLVKADGVRNTCGEPSISTETTSTF